MTWNLPTIAKELSWLAFNGRVLQEAADTSVPEIQRLHYLGIFSNNLDEFFRVRVADARKLAAFSQGEQKLHYNQLFDDMRSILHQQHQQFSAIYLDILKNLRQHAIYLLHEKQLDEEQQAYAREYFTHHVFPLLSPFLLDDKLTLPALNDEEIYFAVKLRLADESIRYSIIQIPNSKTARFIAFPKNSSRQHKKKTIFIVLDNVIRLFLSDIFMGVFDIVSAEAYSFKLTRDSELELGDGISQSFMDKVSLSLQKRKKADPVRFIYDDKMPDDLLDALKKRLNIGVFDALMPGGRYHNSKDFMNFPHVGPKRLLYPEWPSVANPIAPAMNLFSAIRANDICLYHPYHSFSTVVNFLKTAAVDPDVQAIAICLYRVAQDSDVVEALINAVRNGKQVTAVVELQARFDEANNILAAQRLTEAGAQVIFGLQGIKVHAKVIVVSRMEADGLRYYSHVGTGNFNERTSQVYTDISLITYDQGIGRDMQHLFDFLQRNYLRKNYEHLWVSPHSMRPQMQQLIAQEISHAEQGLPASIVLKCNNLVDEQVIALLYRASEAGVKIQLIVRGMCSVIAGQTFSKNIEAISIVDRYLEHARIYKFHNAGAPRYFISSADLMTRNIDFRVEVTCPVYDARAQKLLDTIISTQWQDNVKARVLDVNMRNQKSVKGRRRMRSQEYLHHALQQLQTTIEPKAVLYDDAPLSNEIGTV